MKAMGKVRDKSRLFLIAGAVAFYALSLGVIWGFMDKSIWQAVLTAMLTILIGISGGLVYSAVKNAEEYTDQLCREIDALIKGGETEDLPYSL